MGRYRPNGPRDPRAQRGDIGAGAGDQLVERGPVDPFVERGECQFGHGHRRHGEAIDGIAAAPGQREEAGELGVPG